MHDTFYEYKHTIHLDWNYYYYYNIHHGGSLNDVECFDKKQNQFVDYFRSIFM